MDRSLTIITLLFLLCIALILFMLDMLIGPVLIPLKETLKILISGESVNSAWKTIIFDFRIPKAMTALLAGMALSVSGLQMQTVFRNPLAGPYVLGISSGASLGVAIVVLGFAPLFVQGMINPWQLGTDCGRLDRFGNNSLVDHCSFSEGEGYNDHFNSGYFVWQRRFSPC